MRPPGPATAGVPFSRWRLHFVLVAWLFSGLFASLASAADVVQVRWVADGDAVHLEDGRWVRLLGIDAPETGGQDGPAQYFAEAARARLGALVVGQRLHLETDGQPVDCYGRTLAYLRLPNGRMVNEILLTDGTAYFFHHRDQDDRHHPRLLDAQRRAMAAGHGFWPRILALPTPEAGWTGVRRSRRFHHPDHPLARSISPRNRVSLPSLEQAFHAGYAPARGSSPWPDAD